MENKNTKRIIEISIVILLTLGWIVICGLSIGKGVLVPFSILSSFTFAGIVAYALIGYKIPHSNFLRYVYLLYALTLGMSSIVLYQTSPTVAVYFGIAAVVGVAFMSGRFHKRKQNAYISLVISWLLIFSLVANYELLKTGDLLTILVLGSQIVQWIIISVIYFAKFDDHIAAGKEEDK